MWLFSLCLWVLSIALSSAVIRDKVYVIQVPEDKSKVAVVTWFEDTTDEHFACEIFKNDRLVEEILKESKEPVPRQVTPEEYQAILEECSHFSLRRKKRSDTNNGRLPPEANDAPRRRTTTPAPDTSTTAEGYDGWSIIFPGTKWCGPGDVSKNYDDLGFHQDTDRCCRAHDFCNDTLAPGETRNNITNTWPFTKLSCQCDDEFYDCLSRVNTVIANTVGNAYFNIARRSCYAKEYPETKKCKKYRTFLKLTCAEYEKDTSKQPVYQWIPAKRYKKLPIPGPLDIELPI